MEDYLDTFQSMRRQEQNYRSIDYLGGEHFQKDHDSLLLLNIKNRRSKLVDWCYQVTDYFQLNRDLVETAITNFDRFVSSRSDVVLDQQKFQLAAMTSLYTVIKIHAPKKNMMKLKNISVMSKNRYSEKQIADMEQDMIQAAGWYLNPPTSLLFVRCLLCILVSASVISVSQSEIVLQYSKIQVEMSLGEYYFVCFEPSYIAVAALANSLELMQLHGYKIEYKQPVLLILFNISEIDVNAVVFRTVQTALFDTFKDKNIIKAKESSSAAPLGGGIAPSTTTASETPICNSPRSIVS